MTRQEIIDSLQTCRNAKCFDCKWDSKDYPVCMDDFIDGIAPHIIHELQRIDYIVNELEECRNFCINKSKEERLDTRYTISAIYSEFANTYDRIATLVKGDDTNANSTQP